MWQFLTSPLVNFWKRGWCGNFSFRTLQGERLNLLSITLLVIFDLVMVAVLLEGLKYQGGLADQPQVRFPSWCHYQPADKRNSDALAKKILSTHNGLKQDSLYAYWSPECEQLAQAFDQRQSALGQFATKDRQLASELSNINREISNYKREYRLFRDENKANLVDQQKTISQLPLNIRDEYEKLLDEKKLNEKNRQRLYQQVVDINGLKDALFQHNTTDLYQQAQFWQPVLHTGYQLVLVAPLMLIVFGLRRWWGTHSGVVQVLLGHLQLMLSLILLWIIIKTVYWILPKRFLADIYDWLTDHRLMAVWQYLSVIIGVAVFGVVIALSQKTLRWYQQYRHKQAKLEAERLDRQEQFQRTCAGNCWACNGPLGGEHRFCARCGQKTREICSECGVLMPVKFYYCTHCGKPQDS